MTSHRKCRDDFFSCRRRHCNAHKLKFFMWIDQTPSRVNKSIRILRIFGKYHEVYYNSYEMLKWFVDMIPNIVSKNMQVSIEIVSMSMHPREQMHYYHSDYYSWFCFVLTSIFHGVDALIWILPFYRMYHVLNWFQACIRLWFMWFKCA